MGIFGGGLTAMANTSDMISAPSAKPGQISTSSNPFVAMQQYGDVMSSNSIEPVVVKPGKPTPAVSSNMKHTATHMPGVPGMGTVNASKNVVKATKPKPPKPSYSHGGGVGTAGSKPKPRPDPKPTGPPTPPKPKPKPQPSQPQISTKGDKGSVSMSFGGGNKRPKPQLPSSHAVHNKVDSIKKPDKPKKPEASKPEAPKSPTGKGDDKKPEAPPKKGEKEPSKDKDVKPRPQSPAGGDNKKPANPSKDKDVVPPPGAPTGKGDNKKPEAKPPHGGGSSNNKVGKPAKPGSSKKKLSKYVKKGLGMDDGLGSGGPLINVEQNNSNSAAASTMDKFSGFMNPGKNLMDEGYSAGLESINIENNLEAQKELAAYEDSLSASTFNAKEENRAQRQAKRSQTLMAWTGQKAALNAISANSGPTSYRMQGQRLVPQGESSIDDQLDAIYEETERYSGMLYNPNTAANVSKLDTDTKYHADFKNPANSFGPSEFAWNEKYDNSNYRKDYLQDKFPGHHFSLTSDLDKIKNAFHTGVNLGTRG